MELKFQKKNNSVNNPALLKLIKTFQKQGKQTKSLKKLLEINTKLKLPLTNIVHSSSISFTLKKMKIGGHNIMIIQPLRHKQRVSYFLLFLRINLQRNKSWSKEINLFLKKKGMLYKKQQKLIKTSISYRVQ